VGPSTVVVLSRTGETDADAVTTLASDATPASCTVGVDADPVTATDSLTVDASGDKSTASFEGGLYPPLPDRSTTSLEGGE